MQRFILILSLFISLCSCGFSELFSTVGVDPPPAWECKGTLKIHPQMLQLRIDLIYSSLFFGSVYHSDSSHLCYADYEYKFVSKNTTEKIHKNSTLYSILDSDKHVRFSLFDKNNVEKSYDIDLSEILHSYTFKGDSVEIKMPENGTTEISIACPYCSTHRIYDSLCQGIFACNYQSTEQKSVIVGTDSSWGKSYGFKLYLANQSSMKTDSIFIYGDITFR